MTGIVRGQSLRAPAGGDDVPSPCISVCTMMPQSGLCAGCFRSLDEIAAWGALDPEAKRAVLARLPARRALHEREAHETRLATDAKR